MEPRQKILEAAVRVFAENGYRGATTRRIAIEAGVNEVTLFRQFGSKEELLREAVRCAGRESFLHELPHEPVDPESELTEWSRIHHSHLYDVRGFICASFGEAAEHPDIGSIASEQPKRVSLDLRRYLRALREHGFTDQEFDDAAAAALLMGSLFMDALNRDIMPDLYPYRKEDAPGHYVKLLLSAIGVQRRPA